MATRTSVMGMESLPADQFTLIKQGAEARVFEGIVDGRRCVVKERFKKAYRHPELDAKLTARRNNQEVRCIAKCGKKGLPVPEVFFVDTARFRIFMDFVDSPTMRDYINSVRDLADQKDALAAALGEIGRIIAAMHDMGVIHGDLTTSNMMRQGDGQIVVIDFGLASSSSNTEDKAVDLYVLERAFTSTHCHSDALFQLVMDGYAAASTKADVTLRKFKDVKLRGRKRSMLG